VWWAKHPSTAPRPHPVVLLSWDLAFDFRSQITVAPITSTVRGIDSEVALDEADGLAHPCVANLDAIATIPRGLLIERLCALRPARMRDVDRAVHLALGMCLPCGVE
jgi:mRNA interferase MazF